MLRPVSSGQILYPLLALLAVASAGAFVFGRRRADGGVLAVFAIALLIAAYGAFVGANNPGMAQYLTAWAGGTLVYGAWVLGADRRLIAPLLCTIAWATIALSMMIILYVGSQLGVIPSLLPQWLLEETGAGFNIEEGSTAIRLYGLSTLVAAAPMWVTAALLPDHPYLPRRAVRILAGASAAAAAMLGGRNAIVLVLLVVPMIIIAGRAMLKRRPSLNISPLAFLAGAVVILASPLVWIFASENAAIQRTWSSIILFFSGQGQSERLEQIDRLVDGWSASPLFGQGLGATISGYARSAERPWNFEMQYHLLLFQLGLVGMLLLAAMLITAGKTIAKGMRADPSLSPVFITALAGAGGMLVANATNPYLQAPGHMWALFLPLLVTNVATLRPLKSRVIVPQEDTATAR